MRKQAKKSPLLRAKGGLDQEEINASVDKINQT